MKNDKLNGGQYRFSNATIYGRFQIYNNNTTYLTAFDQAIELFEIL